MSPSLQPVLLEETEEVVQVSARSAVSTESPWEGQQLPQTPTPDDVVVAPADAAQEHSTAADEKVQMHQVERSEIETSALHAEGDKNGDEQPSSAPETPAVAVAASSDDGIPSIEHQEAILERETEESTSVELPNAPPEALTLTETKENVDPVEDTETSGDTGAGAESEHAVEVATHAAEGSAASGDTIDAGMFSGEKPAVEASAEESQGPKESANEVAPEASSETPTRLKKRRRRSREKEVDATMNGDIIEEAAAPPAVAAPAVPTSAPAEPDLRQHFPSIPSHITSGMPSFVIWRGEIENNFFAFCSEIVRIRWAMLIDRVEWTFGYSKLANQQMRLDWDLEDGLDNVQGTTEIIPLKEGEDYIDCNTRLRFSAAILARDLNAARFKPKIMTFTLHSETDKSIIGLFELDLRTLMAPGKPESELRFKLVDEETRKPRSTSPSLVIMLKRVKWESVNGEKPSSKRGGSFFVPGACCLSLIRRPCLTDVGQEPSAEKEEAEGEEAVLEENKDSRKARLRREQSTRRRARVDAIDAEEKSDSASIGTSSSSSSVTSPRATSRAGKRIKVTRMNSRFETVEDVDK